MRSSPDQLIRSIDKGQRRSKTPSYGLLPEETPVSLNSRSCMITEGVERSPNRAMLRAVGFRDSDFDKPIIGIANGYSTITPCNAGLNDLAIRAASALRESGTMPQLFGTITVSDGISM